jgi:hypothetical protein
VTAFPKRPFLQHSKFSPSLQLQSRELRVSVKMIVTGPITAPAVTLLFQIELIPFQRVDNFVADVQNANRRQSLFGRWIQCCHEASQRLFNGGSIGDAGHALRNVPIVPPTKWAITDIEAP